MKTLVNKQSNFELNSALNGQPVEFLQCRCNMSPSIKTKCEMACIVLHMLQRCR